MATTPSVSKPQTAYWMWLCDNREKIVAIVGSKITEVAKKGGEMWKALPEAGRAPWEKKAKDAKEAYEKYVATDEGKKALEEKKAGKAEEKAGKIAKEEARAEKNAKKEEMRNNRACKAAVKAVAVEKDDALKKPASAYWLWLGDNREKIAATCGSKGSEVAKKGGEMWKALAAAAKAPWEKKAKDQKDAYDKYIATPEGAAALKAFKDATQAARDEFKPKVEETAVEETDKKRKADVPAEKVAAPKKARGKAAALGA